MGVHVCILCSSVNKYQLCAGKIDISINWKMFLVNSETIIRTEMCILRGHYYDKLYTHSYEMGPGWDSIVIYITSRIVIYITSLIMRLLRI